MTSKEAYNLVLHELEQNTNFTKDSTFGKAVDILNDLVERDTPRKHFECEISCYGSHYSNPDSFSNNFCGRCGQRLEWVRFKEKKVKER